MASTDGGDLARSRLGAIARTAGRVGAGMHEADEVAGTAGEYDEPEPYPPRLTERIAAARWATGHRGSVALAGVAVLAVVIALGVVWRDRPVPEPVPPLPSVDSVVATAPVPQPVPEPENLPADLVVSVVGLVHRPGLVTTAPARGSPDRSRRRRLHREPTSYGLEPRAAHSRRRSDRRGIVSAAADPAR